jgi:hypothetical protein
LKVTNLENVNCTYWSLTALKSAIKALFSVL